ncbi:N-acetylgalactosamine kinase-like [Macrosteles quadrilineatus]|uniref:N-acetylgalactosamine kinase-like n=1 Tax=Macrosteles quadrilineatus TaxID=74068 RepID=UPI0023E2DDF0|nr:N-acetylgalactosamine kinase-like [Macrosteles quadrilineatus]XP_054289580.1 N-acetylgalactosamine kinase-like [Macrosteles quadrilineatus]XP_054289581.1 N-acetylgalactosamine kinase-like [Macrosteles quadrilineatus]
MEKLGNGNCEHAVPTLNDFPEESSLRNRLHLLREKFSCKFKAKPSLYLRVPGRVNLIGEHIDYCGYSVCPLALEQDILVAFCPSVHGQFLSIYNQDEENYKEYSIDTFDFKFSLPTTGWASYVLCGVKKVIELLVSQGKSPVSIQMAVAGNIPPGSGLSSSSALVCAGAMVTALANKLNLSRTELAALSAEAEHYIGTVGGGMDQAIIFLASEGNAKLIEFSPLRTRDVTLPAGAVFVVAHSLAVKNKAASNDFNTRVVECRLAAQVLAKIRGFPWKKCLRLVDFQTSAKLTLGECAKIVKELLHKDPYTKIELCKILDVTEKELNEITLTSNTEHVQHFKLFQRALHVFQEAQRVAEFEAGCTDGCSLAELGHLMSESHVSLRDLYECSHVQLDRLVAVAMAAGALGARLTGAGWGGCIVALTTEDHVGKFIDTVKQQFYADNPQVEGRKTENLIFATQPGRGVQVFRPEENDLVH